MGRKKQSYTRESKIITFRVEISVYDAIIAMAMERQTSITKIIEEIVTPVINKRIAALERKGAE